VEKILGNGDPHLWSACVVCHLVRPPDANGFSLDIGHQKYLRRFYVHERRQVSQSMLVALPIHVFDIKSCVLFALLRSVCCLTLTGVCIWLARNNREKKGIK